MELIERYLYALKNYLPKENKEDIIKEVESIIHEMLNGDYSDENVNKVLKKLGHPRTFSLEYKNKNRYLIGPEYFDSYVKTLIYVCLLVGSIFLIISMFGILAKGIMNETVIDYIVSIFTNSLESFFDGAVVAAIIVTVIYASIERSNVVWNGKDKIVKKEEWEPIMLPVVPKAKTKEYKRVSLFIDIFVNILFTSLFIVLAKYIGIYNNNKLVAELFIMDRFKLYIVVFIIMLLILVFNNLVMIYYRYPNYKTALIKTIYNILNTIIFIVFINDKYLFNPGFKTELINITNMSVEQFNSIFGIVITILTVLVIIGNIIDTITIFYKSYQNEINK